MEDWNENDWQGKRREQVNYSSKALFFGTIALIAIIVISSVSTFLR
jgi:hypothetical protein